MKDNSNDYDVMRLRTLASNRGAKPADIQRNIARIERMDHEYVAERFGPATANYAQFHK